MADKVAEQKPVESTVNDVVEKAEKTTKEVEEVEEEKEEAKVENGDSKAENGDSKDKEEKEEKAEKNGDDVDASDKCTIKRKSTSGGEAQDVTPAEGATPEKKAKLDETAEAEVTA